MPLSVDVELRITSNPGQPSCSTGQMTRSVKRFADQAVSVSNDSSSPNYVGLRATADKPLSHLVERVLIERDSDGLHNEVAAHPASILVACPAAPPGTQRSLDAPMKQRLDGQADGDVAATAGVASGAQTIPPPRPPAASRAHADDRVSGPALVWCCCGQLLGGARRGRSAWRRCPSRRRTGRGARGKACARTGARSRAPLRTSCQTSRAVAKSNMTSR